MRTVYLISTHQKKYTSSPILRTTADSAPYPKEINALFRLDLPISNKKMILGVAYTSTQREVQKLEAASIIKKTPITR